MVFIGGPRQSGKTTLPEIDSSYQRKTTLELLKFGGFPEPFLGKNENEYRRWKREHVSRVVYQDISDLGTINDGAKFENMVAGHLLKYCHFLEDTEGHKMELRFIRDIDLREIDFVV